MKNKFLKSFYFIFTLMHISAIFAANKDYFSSKLSVNFPSKIAMLELQDLTDFEKNSIGLGIGLSYRTDEIRADVYIYDMGFSDIPDGINSDISQMSFQSAIIEIHELAKRRIYNKLKDLSDCTVKKIGNLEFLIKKFNYIERGSQKESFLLLTCKSGSFIKIRLTYNTISDSDLRSVGEQFLESVSEIISASKPKQ